MGALLGILPSLFKVGGKLIQDADQRAEYVFKVQEMAQKFMEKMLETKTYPWVDGLVKLAYAAEAIIKGLFRPVVSALMFVFAAYAEVNGINLSEGLQVLLYGAFPAWGASRHQEKKKTSQKASKEVWEDDDYSPF